jgi:TRAP-type mannitol/chloroaromatic compound transport system permease large subunit
MTAWIMLNLAPIMFGCLALFLISGIPVAFALASCGLLFGFIGIELGMLPPSLMQALPSRVLGIMSNETLLAIPFFTFMGMVLQRSGMAEDLLETVGQVFGAMRGGLALAVVVVGSLLAATTGVVAASIIAMGLISMPIMLRYGYDRRIASGVITAAGSLAQVVPPSLVLIVMADQLGRSVGEMYAGALLPALMLIGAYAALVVVLAIVFPKMLPALPPEALIYKEADGSGGHRSLAVLTVLSAIAGWLALRFYPTVLEAIDRNTDAPKDELVMVALAGGVTFAFIAALADTVLRTHWLSRLARRVAFVLIPPLLLIFLVLGTIFLGIATPTEGGAMGAVGALVLAVARKRLDVNQTMDALLATTKLTAFVLFILIGATVFSLAFQAVDGNIWVEHLFDKLPGGSTGFLIAVTALVFVLGFFLDFFEIAFISLPLLAPIAAKLGIDLIWFGVLIGINLQTSFLTPPFGFALFYLRSVAPSEDYTDAETGQPIARVTTGQIYAGALPFIAIQVLLLALIIAFPQIVIGDRADADKFKAKPGVISERMLDMAPVIEYGSGPEMDMNALFGLEPESPASPASAPVAGPQPKSMDKN